MDDSTLTQVEDASDPDFQPAESAGRTPHIWDEATRPEVARLVEAYEEAWRSARLRKPAIDAFMKEHGCAHEGVRLALLRAEMALRWESGERVRAEKYLQRFGPLSDEQVVALAYEEFCLREDAGEEPAAAEYYKRFPGLSARLRPLFDIHELVGTGSSTALSTPLPDDGDLIYPGVNETIGGFYLVQELGRGAFARVYLATERNLSNRPVALKVARFGTREPQVLARLQHTHIVPIHSYRTDAATGLHLICMPYVGRVTLSRLLAHDEMKLAERGSEVLKVVESLDPDAAKTAEGAAAGTGLEQRQKFARLGYGRAIALWGARLAEALSYAHEHGVLHGDIKPSNVLITADGMPMLLDFNLAQAVASDGGGAQREALGGTFPYMSPEQLEALAGAESGEIDARSDIFSLGVVLYEAMGTRPFEKKPTFSAGSLNDVLLQAASQRRREHPRLREAFPEVSAAFEAVVRKCLAPEPEARYATAAQLAEDLQAVADDGPLRHAREPQPDRALRWVRRNRVGLTLAVPVLLSAVFLAIAAVGARFHIMWVEKQANELLIKAGDAERDGRPAEAIQFFNSAREMVKDREELAPLESEARRGLVRAKLAKSIRQSVAELYKDSGPLRFALMGFDPRDQAPEVKIRERLKPFRVFQMADWRTMPELSLLDEGQPKAVAQEVDELLFFWAVAVLAKPGASKELVADVERVCEKAVVFTSSPGPWRALAEIAAARRENRAVSTLREPRLADVASAWPCFQWGLIHSMLDQNQSAWALRWLNRSVRLDPHQYWAQYFLGYRYDREGMGERAVAHYNAAIALEPDSPWAIFSRGRLAWPRGEWEQARLDLDRAVELADRAGQPFPEARLERGLVRQRLGDFDGARADYEYVLKTKGDHSPLGRTARMNAAHIAYSEGDLAQTRSEYDALLAEQLSVEDRALILPGRIRLLAHEGAWKGVERDLAELSRLKPEDAGVLALHAEMALLRSQPEAALQFAQRAESLDADLSHSRLRNRAALAAKRFDRFQCDHPEEIWMLPGGRAALRDDLRHFAGLDTPPETSEIDLCLSQATVRAALGDRRALAQAEEIVARWPELVRAHVVNARVKLALGQAEAARGAAEAGLALEPADCRLLEVKARARLSEGAAREALVLLEQAGRSGMTPTLHATLARANRAAKNWKASLRAWNAQVGVDPQNPEWYLCRARVARRLGMVEQALADLEVAADLAEPSRADLMARIAFEYAGCARGRKHRVERVAYLAKRVIRGD